MIRRPVNVIDDWSGGQDTKTPILKMGLNKSPNMRNFHCAGVGNRLRKRGGFSKLNSSAVATDDLDVYYPPGYQTINHALRDTAANTEISQGFKPNTTSTVTKVRLWLKSTGTPGGTDTVTLEIHTDSSGIPSGTPVTNGTSDAVDISDTLTSSYAWVEFTFSTNPSLTANTQYHLVLTGAFTISSSNYVQWGADDFDVIYPDGSMSVNDGTTWTTELNYDACFEVYMDGGAKGDDGKALFDFSSKNMMLGIFGTALYKMDKDSSGTPDGVWDSIGGGTSWDSYTVLVLHCDGSDTSTTFTDETGNHTVTANGNAQVDTAQSKFGGASALFDGTGDYLSMGDSSLWDFGTDDFTIDFWVRFNALPTSGNTVTLFDNDGTNGVRLNLSNTAGVYELRTHIAGSSAAENWTTPSTGTWYHIAIVRTGGSRKIFIDGVEQGSGSSLAGSISGLTNGFTIGSTTAGTIQFLNGWVDEFRVSKGIARWTANFTPPTAAYSPDSIEISSSRYLTFGDWQSGRALINTDIGLYTYTGTGSASNVSAAPLGHFLIIWKEYAFIFGIRGTPNQARYSDQSDYTTWPASNTLNFNTNDGDTITGARILKGKLYIFKRYSVHRVTFLGSNPTFQVDQILGIGSPSHYTIKEVDFGGDIGSAMIFLTSDKKLAIFDGYNIQVLTDDLSEESNDLFESSDDQSLSFADINLLYSDKFHAVVKRDTYEYILYVVLGDDTDVNYAFVLDYKIGGIFPYDGQIFDSSVYMLSTDKGKLLYASGRAGYTFEMESGNDDNGSAINAYWVSAKIRPTLASLAVKMLQLALHLKEISSGSTLNISFQYRIDWGVTWTTAINVNFDRNDDFAYGKTSLIDIGTVQNMLQIKIKDSSSNPAPELLGVDLYGIPLGLDAGERATS